jgi:hypothetical protein
MMALARRTVQDIPDPGYAVNQLLKSVVRKICTLRSLEAGDG